jgi:hypothetical protein
MVTVMDYECDCVGGAVWWQEEAAWQGDGDLIVATIAAGDHNSLLAGYELVVVVPKRGCSQETVR